MAAWISKLTAEGNKIGNKALADHATAEKEKARSGSNPQYGSSGKSADDMTLHGGKKSNHAIVFQTTGFTKMLDGTVSALKAAGYTDAEINRLRGIGDATWANFEAALDDLRKKLDKNPKEEKALITLETHGSKESRTVAYAPGMEGKAGGGALISAAGPSFAMEVTDPVVLATLAQDLPKPGGGVFSHDPELARNGPATLRLSTFEEHLAGSTSVGVSLNGQTIGALQMGASLGADYQLAVPDEVLSLIFGDVRASGRLTLGLNFASAGDWIRIATEQDWADPTTAALDYGVGIAADCCAATASVPEPGTWLLMAIGLIGLGLRKRSR
jgi:hypothetical protein